MYLRLSNGGRLMFGDRSDSGALLIGVKALAGGSTGGDARSVKEKNSKQIAEAMRRAAMRRDQKKTEDKPKKPSRRAKKSATEKEKFDEITAPIARDIEIAWTGTPSAMKEGLVSRLSRIQPEHDPNRLRQQIESAQRLEVELNRRREAAADEQEAIALILLSMN